MELNTKEQIARTKLCLPLDELNSIEQIKQRVEELAPYVGLFKIGKETFTRFGPESVRLVQSYGSNVFLDLKYHDIPNTVKGAANAATQLGVYMFNVHASGGIEMMKAAMEGVNKGVEEYKVTPPKVVAVTMLTSIDEKMMNEQLRIPGRVDEQVLQLAQLANQAGLDGIVCSAADLNVVRMDLPPNFMYVTPGIQGPNIAAGKDQKRVFTPYNAIKDGSTILVVGRAITAPKTSAERQKAAYEVLQDMARAL